MIIIDNNDTRLVFRLVSHADSPNGTTEPPTNPSFLYVGTMILVSEGALRSSLLGPCVTFMRSELKLQV